MVPVALVVDSRYKALLVFGSEVPALVAPNAYLDTILWQVVIWLLCSTIRSILLVVSDITDTDSDILRTVL